MSKSTIEVGNRLVELCKEGKHRQAIEELYADTATSIEVMDGGPEMPRVITGKNELLTHSDKFDEMNDIHGGEVDGPYPHDDEFICFMSIDLTPTVGPMAGQRMQMKEAAKYAVKDGKITESRFYYDMGDCEA